jgi:hypothetical protein
LRALVILQLQSDTVGFRAHEVGHCKLRDAFLNRPDGSAADSFCRKARFESDS